MTAVARSEQDEAYVRANYATLEQLGRGLGEAAWIGEQLPKATYALADGSAWYPRDWWRLFDDARGWIGGDDLARDVAAVLEAVPRLFARRLAAAARALGHDCDVDDEWQSYVSGVYGACLRDVTPEALAHKEALVAEIGRAMQVPRPDDEAWCAELRGRVECLDGLCRPFAACDRVRFGRTTSRDRWIVDVRRRFPQVFA